MAEIFQLLVPGHTLKLPDDDFATYRVGPFLAGSSWYAFLMDIADHRVKCYELFPSTGMIEEVDAGASLKPELPDNDALGDFEGWEQWEAVSDDRKPTASAVYVVHLDGSVGGVPKPFKTSKFSLVQRRWDFGSGAASPHGISDMDDSGLAMKSFHAGSLFPPNSVDGFAVAVGFTELNGSSNARPMLTAWRTDNDTWLNPALEVNFVASSESIDIAVGAAVEVFDSSACQFIHRLGFDLTVPGFLEAQALERSGAAFALGTSRRLHTAAFSFALLGVGVAAKPIKLTHETQYPWHDFATGDINSFRTPPNETLPDAVEIFVGGGGPDPPTPFATFLYPATMRVGDQIRLYVTDNQSSPNRTQVWRWIWNDAAFSWGTPELLHTFITSEDGFVVGAAVGGGRFATGFWYLVSLQTDGGDEDSRTVWAIFEGVGSSYTGPAEGIP